MLVVLLRSPRLSDNGFLERHEPAGECFVARSPWGRDRVDRLVRGFRETFVEIVA